MISIINGDFILCGYKCLVSGKAGINIWAAFTRTGGAVGKPWLWAFRWMKPNVIAHSMLCLPNQSDPTLVET